MTSAIDQEPDRPPLGECAEGMWRELCSWFALHRRDLPWRRTSDPYAVWVSEAMLQQTRVETVIPYWERFMQRLPTISDLAAAEEQELLALWSGLGYYRRARALRLAARAILERFGGRFPDLREDALSLPGIGPYTAGAVLSIAYDLPLAAVDGNVMRVFSRLFGLAEPWGSSALARRVWSLAEELVRLDPGEERDVPCGPGAWNQALMELGATVCTSRNPSCGACPWRARCVAHGRDLVDRLPVPGPRQRAIGVVLEILVVHDRGRLLLERRPEEGRMAGLWELPTRELPPLPAETGETRLFPPEFGIHVEGAKLTARRELTEIRHSITRHRIRATIRSAELSLPDGAGVAAPWRWAPLEELESLALTGMTSKVLKRKAAREFLALAANR